MYVKVQTTLLFITCTTMVACAGSGFGKGLRPDVEARMNSIRTPLATCYKQALKRDRNAQGTMVVSFVAHSGTGKFADVHVLRSDIADPDMQQCVVGQVQTL